MAQAQVTLTFKSEEEAELFIAKFLYCGGEQATGFCIIKDKSDWNEKEKKLHLASQADKK